MSARSSRSRSTAAIAVVSDSDSELESCAVCAFGRHGDDECQDGGVCARS